jgi:hypothetical protein
VTLDELRQLRDVYPFRPVLMTLHTGEKVLIEAIGITPRGVVLAVSRDRTRFLAPQQIIEARMVPAVAG